MQRLTHLPILRTVALTLGVLAVGGWLVDAAAQKRFEDTTDVLVVEVPVQVLRDGEPVRGLTADDFEVLDGRKKMEIVSFDVIDLTIESEPGAPEPPPPPVAARRHFLLLFDLTFSDPGSIVQARKAARELVETALHPSDLVGVATFTGSGGAELRLGFTSDRRQVDIAIETLGLPQVIETVRDPLNLVMADVSSFRTLDGGDGGSQGGVGDLGFDPEAEVLETLTQLETDLNRATQTAHVQRFTQSMARLAAMLRAVDGRKHVVFLSEGFDSSVMVGLDGATQGEQARIQAMNEAAMSGEVWNVNSDDRFGNTNTLSTMDAMVDEFLRADCTVQSVNIGGLAADGEAGTGTSSRARASRGEQGLFMLANETGGEYYRNFNDLSVAMDKMLERTSVTYVLSIQPTNVERDDSFHKIKVRLKNEGRGVRLVHRPGYFSPKPYREQPPEVRQLQTASMIVGGRDSGVIDTAVLATAFEASGPLAYVPVLIEIDGASLLAGHGDDVLPTELFAYAIGADGSVRDYFTQQLGLDLKKVGGALRQSGFKFWGHFELEPGEYTVRVLVRNISTSAVGLRVAKLSVPDFVGEQPALLPPLFPEPPGSWLLGREQGAENQGFDYPFLMGGQPFIPAARPKIAAGGQATVSLVGYNLDEGELTVSSRLIDPLGKAVEGVSVDLESRPRTGVYGLDRLEATLQAGEVAAGRYTLEVTVSDAAGQARTASIPIEIG